MRLITNAAAFSLELNSLQTWVRRTWEQRPHLHFQPSLTTIWSTCRCYPCQTATSRLCLDCIIWEISTSSCFRCLTPPRSRRQVRRMKERLICPTNLCWSSGLAERRRDSQQEQKRMLFWRQLERFCWTSCLCRLLPWRHSNGTILNLECTDKKKSQRWSLDYPTRFWCFTQI